MSIEAALEQLLSSMGQTPDDLASKIVDMLNESGFDAADQLETVARVNSMLAISLVTNQASKEMTGEIKSDLSKVLDSIGGFTGEMSRRVLEDNKVDILTKAIDKAEDWLEDGYCDCEACDEKKTMLERNLPVLRRQLAEAETTH